MGKRCAVRSSVGAAVIPVPSGVRVWLAVGRTDMRRGMNGLALQLQQALRRDPHAGDLCVFRGARGNQIKILWHDGLGMSLYAKRVQKGRFIWLSPADGAVGISASQLSRKWKVIQHVREKFTYRDCEKISQTPAPFHDRKGWAGPSPLAMILF